MPAARLPVWDTVRKSLNDVVEDFPGFLRRYWPFVILWGVLVSLPGAYALDAQAMNALMEAAKDSAQPPPFDQMMATVNPLMVLLSGVSMLALFSLYTLRWSRQLLLGETLEAPELLRFGKPAWHVLFTWLKIYGVFLGGALIAGIGFAVLAGLLAVLKLPQELSGLLSFAVVLGLLTAAIVVGMRICLALPLAAIDEPAPLKTSWNMMKGYLWPVGLGLTVLMLLLMLAGAVAGLVVGIIFGVVRLLLGDGFLMVLVNGLFNALIFVVTSGIVTAFNARIIAFLRHQGNA
ncbi:MAG TPA: hypothetical protein VHB73_05670 [Alphaproteobacteria bacterium]|nr:hypothetical protein [Alphaproteobacteria bacterium]